MFVCLTACFLIPYASCVMIPFRKLRKRDASKFHVQLCIAMFCMLLVFLTGVQRTSVYGGCVTVSLLIHYFTLVTVMWMGAEAVLMFQKLVIVFVTITTKYFVIVSFICWCKYCVMESIYNKKSSYTCFFLCSGPNRPSHYSSGNKPRLCHH